MTGERSVDVAAASGTLHVALLGGFSVRVGSRVVPASWRLRKSKTLVKLLALAGDHRAHRDVLAGVLWPALDPAAAANNLHQALHAARRALASDRSPSAHTLCLRDDIVILWPDGDLIVDADVFAAAAQRALRSGSVEDYGAALERSATPRSTGWSPTASPPSCAPTGRADSHPGALEYTRSGVTRTAARRSSAMTRS